MVGPCDTGLVGDVLTFRGLHGEGHRLGLLQRLKSHCHILVNNLYRLNLAQQVASLVLQVDIISGVLNQTVERVGHAVGDDIAQLLSAPHVDEFQEHVLVECRIAAIGQVHLQCLHLVGEGQDGKLLPTISILIGGDNLGRNVDNQSVVQSI